MLKRLAMISEHASPMARLGGVDSGGQNIYVGQLAKGLARLGYEVDLFTRRDHPLVPEVAEWVPGVRLVHVPVGPAAFVRKEELLPFMPAFGDYMLEFCRREHYDLVHANFWMSGMVAQRLKRDLGLPFAITFHALGKVRRLHQGAADEFPNDRVTIEESIVAEADQVIAECPQDQRDLHRLYGADRAKTTMIPCGFDPAEFWPLGKELARAALGFRPEERIILQLGRIVRRKGIDNVIRGLGHLRQKDLWPRLLIVGGDSATPDPASHAEMRRLLEVARAAGVAEQVTLVGARPRETLKYYYGAADVFVSTPWYEPFGITPLEAMACGTPVIASDVGGLKYSVRHGQTGFLVRPDDPLALADKLHELYARPMLWEYMRREAIRHVNDLFTWDRIARMAAALFERLAASADLAQAVHEPAWDSAPLLSEGG
jgi:D-inositol-3-phosphate glycosyltransferase